MWRNQSSHKLLVGAWSSTAALENSLAVPQNLNMEAIIWFSNSMLGYIPKKIENMSP